MRNNSFDVMVIGGGPSGLQTAGYLSQAGLRVVLFDENDEIGKDVVCSGVISREAFSRYTLPEEAVVGRLQHAQLFSPTGASISYAHPEEAAVVVDRHVFDGKLGEAARGKGTEIRLNTKVSSLSVHENYVEANVITPEGEDSVKARIAVIATGISFKLQNALGLGRPKKILKGIQVEVKTNGAGRDLRVYFGRRWSEGFFGWAIPLMDGRTRVGVMTNGNAVEGLKNVLIELSHNGGSCAELEAVKRRGIAFGALRKSYSDRVMAVGEAAGLIKTTTGGGIYYGLISAEIASQVIIKAFAKKSFDAGTLSEYERIWKRSIGKEIKFGLYFHRFYSNLDDYHIEKLFYAAREDGLLSFVADRGRFDWHRDAVIKILRSPHLRSVLWSGLIRQAIGA